MDEKFGSGMKLEGLILAGGRSSRMGGNHKGELVYREHTFVEHLLREFQRETDRIWLSYGTEEKKQYLGCESILDLYPNCGPMGGIHAGLSLCQGEALMVAACDMPMLRMELFYDLLEHMEQAKQEKKVRILGAVPVTGGKIHPLAAIYRTEMKEFFQKQILEGNYRMTDALKRAEILYVDVTEQEMYVSMLRNVNTFSEYDALLEVK